MYTDIDKAFGGSPNEKPYRRNSIDMAKGFTSFITNKGLSLGISSSDQNTGVRKKKSLIDALTRF